MRSAIMVILAVFVLLFAAGTYDARAQTPLEPLAAPADEPRKLFISEVSVNREAFNPSANERVEIRYTISQPVRVSIQIFDSEWMLVRELIADSPDGGLSVESWDGLDFAGRIVPDEAYFFTIDAFDYQSKMTTYDPTLFSGRQVIDMESLKVQKTTGRITYQLREPARVSLRAGVPRNGPLLYNILSDVPMTVGSHTLQWDGKDASGTVELAGMTEWEIAAEAVSLPRNTIITYGNAAYDFFQYKSSITEERPQKQDRGGSSVTQHNLRRWGRRLIPEPKFRIELPTGQPGQAGSVLSKVSGKIPVKIFLHENIKRHALERRFEVVLFVDFAFITEVEEGYSPITLMLDTTKFGDGEHLITVNVVTLPGQISAASRKVVFWNE